MLGLALGCGEGPTAIVVDELPGRWQLDVAENTRCDPDAIARTLTVSISPVRRVGSRLEVSGLWDLGAPTAQGWGLSGTFDEATRSAAVVFVHPVGTALQFTGTISDGRTLRGRMEPPRDYPPLADVGTCTQSATARRLGD
jgi:hypothetical protein